MSQAGNIFFVSEVIDGVAEGVYLYSHKYHFRMMKSIVEAFGNTRSPGRARRDASYLTRILIQYTLNNYADTGDHKGFGISTMLCKTGNPVLVVHPRTQAFYLVREGDERYAGQSNGIGASMGEAVDVIAYSPFDLANDYSSSILCGINKAQSDVADAERQASMR